MPNMFTPTRPPRAYACFGHCGGAGSSPPSTATCRTCRAPRPSTSISAHTRGRRRGSTVVLLNLQCSLALRVNAVLSNLQRVLAISTAQCLFEPAVGLTDCSPSSAASDCGPSCEKRKTFHVPSISNKPHAYRGPAHLQSKSLHMLWFKAKPSKATQSQTKQS